MSTCPDEITSLRYVDEELDSEALHAFEVHLVTCRDCRERIVALREESRLLTAVMHERRREAPPEVSEAPEPSVAIGVPLAIGGVAMALAATGELLESRLPGSLDLLHPRRLKGAYEMAFDLVFLVRENAPGLLELGFAVGVVASVSALLSFFVSSFSKRVFDGGASLLVVLGFCLAAAAPADAFEVHRDVDVLVASGERIPSTLVARGGDRVDIDGVVEGDLIVAAERITIRGEIRGSIYAFCRDLDISGNVAGAVLGVVENIRIEGSVAGSVYVGAEDLTLASNGNAGGDMALFVEEVVIAGTVGRDLALLSEDVDLRGTVERNVRAYWAENLRLRDGARVGGDFRARVEGDVEDVFEQSAGAEIAGEVDVTPVEGMKEHYLDAYRSWRFYGLHLLGFAASFVFGLVLYRLVPGVFENRLVTGGDLLRHIGIGFAAMVVIPIALLAVGLTIIGLPLAIAGLFLYIAAIYTADVVIGAWLGRWLFPPAGDGFFDFGKSFALGLLLLLAVAMVPFLGPPVGFVAFLVGLGLIAVRTYNVVSEA
ncbi:MAG: hypothetical protein AAF430_20580 [Myxococcota bacterium]